MHIKMQEYRVIGMLQILLAFLLVISLSFYFTSPTENLIPCAFFLTNIISGAGILAIGSKLVRD